MENIFLSEHNMLLSIENDISHETKNIIIDKINKQEKIFLGIRNTEQRMEEKIKNESKPAIDDDYFDKKSLNINNI